MDVKQIKRVANLGFAHGKVGAQLRLAGPEAETGYANQLARHMANITKRSTADCGDDRRTLRLADGTSDPQVLEGRIVSQLFGGLALSAAKAAVAADAVLVRDARNFRAAYETISDFLVQNNYEDGGHKGCGASGTVESSVASPIAPEDQAAAVGLFTPLNEHGRRMLAQINQTKQARLEAGFYGAWDPAWHEDFLSTRFPQNFSILADDPHDHETHGHHGLGLLVVTDEEQGFAKNAFIAETGQEAFCVTPAKMRELAYLLGGTQEETARIELAFYDDTLIVGAGIVAPDYPVFA